MKIFPAFDACVDELKPAYGRKSFVAPYDYPTNSWTRNIQRNYIGMKFQQFFYFVTNVQFMSKYIGRNGRILDDNTNKIRGIFTFISSE